MDAASAGGDSKGGRSCASTALQWPVAARKTDEMASETTSEKGEPSLRSEEAERGLPSTRYFV